MVWGFVGILVVIVGILGGQALSSGAIPGILGGLLLELDMHVGLEILLS